MMCDRRSRISYVMMGWPRLSAIRRESKKFE